MDLIFLIIIGLIIWRISALTKTPPCPKCGGKNIIAVKPSGASNVRRATLFTFLPIIGMFVGQKATQYTCRDDNFQWAK